MEINSKCAAARRDEGFGTAISGGGGEVTWLSDRAIDPFRPRAAHGSGAAWRYDELTFAPDEPIEETGPAHRVVVDPERQVRVVDARTGRRLHLLGEVRLVGRAWRFVLATREHGFRAQLNSTMAARLAQLDGAPMGGPRTPETLSAEISSLLGYDAHR